MISPVFSDENIYINMAKAVANGLAPYKDFFYAHPPVQLYLLSVASIFSFEIVKIYIMAIGLLSVVLTYFISKELFGYKSALATFAAFLVYPGFLIFGSQAMGMFEALLFLLSGTFLLLKKKIPAAAAMFALSFFTRYLVILVLPLIIISFKGRLNNNELKKFAILSFAFIGVFFSALYLLFGNTFISDTIIYQFHSNISEKVGIANWVDQYLTLGYFTIFLSTFTLVYGIFYRNRIVVLFSLFPLVYDMIILLILRQVIYHYFVFSLPFLFISVGKVLSDSKYLSLKIFLVFIIVLSLFTNLKSLEFYLTVDNNKVFYELANYVSASTNDTDAIFGEPRSLNYVSFVTGRKIVGNHFDTDLKFINFAGLDSILGEVNEAKPKLILANQFYTSFFEKDYVPIKEWNKPEYYDLILLKLRDSD